MFCESCGAQIPDGKSFCPMCGTKVAAPVAPAAAPEPQTSVYQEPQPAYQPQPSYEPQPAKAPKAPKEKKGNIGLIITSVLLVAALGFSGFLFSKNKKIAEELDSANKELDLASADLKIARDDLEKVSGDLEDAQMSIESLEGENAQLSDELDEMEAKLSEGSDDYDLGYDLGYDDALYAMSDLIVDASDVVSDDLLAFYDELVADPGDMTEDDLYNFMLGCDMGFNSLSRYLALNYEIDTYYITEEDDSLLSLYDQ